jgi:hypothetical protein
MEILYSVNIFLAFGLLLWPLWFSRVVLGLGWVNPFSILLVLALPVQVMKLIGGPMALIDYGLFDFGYQFALLMGNTYSIAQVVSMAIFFILFRSIRVERYVPWRKRELRPVELLRSARLCFAVFGLSFLLLASAEFGLVNWLINPRTGYQLYRTGHGHWYALAVSFLSASYLLSFLARPRPGPLLLTTIPHIVAAYFLGSKGIMLTMFGATLVFLWFLQWRQLNKLLMLGTPLVFGLLLINLYLALLDSFDLQAIFEYFDYYKNAADYYRGFFEGQVDLFGGEVAWSSIWGYVPRAIWPEKPSAYGILLVNEIFYPGQAEMTNTPAFGGAVEQFADFGVVGVVVYGLFSAQSILAALFSYLLFRRPGFDPHRVTVATVMLMLVQFAPAFGSFFPGALYLMLLVAVLGLVILARTLSPSRGALRRNRPGTAIITERAVSV